MNKNKELTVADQVLELLADPDVKRKLIEAVKNRNNPKEEGEPT